MLISVVMPAYNGEKTIGQAIDSVIGQTFKNWELIVVNDQSKDRTKDLILDYAKRDERIRYAENQENSGVSFSRNRGVAMAEGQWIAFLDSDDAWEKEKLEEQVKLIEGGARFVFTGSAFMNEAGQRLKFCMNIPEKISFRELLKQNVISCSSVLIEKALLEKYPMAQGNIHEDYAVWLKILRDQRICAWGIDKPLLIYRVSSGSKSGNKGKAALMHWRVYRHIKLPIIPSVWYFSFYVVRNLKKYRNIWREGKTSPFFLLL
ncbi:MAG: glycosyltransferase family 2 protein [Hungatella sp.]|nr:glycosyltransferase family 2 protein [Hungatella sp.]